MLRGGKPELLGRPITEYKIASLPNPVIKEDGKLLIGTVIYIDRYGNLVTNLHKKLIADVAKGRGFKILLSRGRTPITKVLGHYYEETESGRAIAIYNAEGLLEIAIFKSASDTEGGATDLLGMRLKDQINIEFA